jgi:hypothetical protein
MTAPHTSAASYEVGYGKPPRHTQFQKGQSGNPGGRPHRLPAGRLNALALHEAYRTTVVMEDGRAVPVSAIQAVLRSQLQIAAAGNVKAQRAILTMIQDIERADAIKAQIAATYGPVKGGDADDDVIEGIDDDVADDGNADSAQQADETGTYGDEEGQEQAAVPVSADSAPPLENAAAPSAGPQPSRRDPTQQGTSQQETSQQESGSGRAFPRSDAPGRSAGAPPARRQPGGRRWDRPSAGPTVQRRRNPGKRSPRQGSPRELRRGSSVRDARAPNHVAQEE